VSVIQIDRLSKRFGSTVAVDDLSFEVDAGSVTGFLGPNGAGKTTTLRTLLGLVTPSAGRATIHGRPYSQLPHPIVQVGALLEAASFHPGRTGRDHLRVLATAGRVPAGRADQVLELVGLADAGRRKVKGYSMGMRQRLGLAAALIGDPEILVLDEPANGLDPEGIRWLRQFLRHLAGQGRTVLISSHLLAEVSQTVDRVVIINHGRLLAGGTVEELLARDEATVRARSPQAGLLLDALRAAGIVAERTAEDTVMVRGAGSPAVGEAAARAGVVLHELVAQRSTLEQVFFELTGPQGGDVPAVQGAPYAVPATTEGGGR
jgi:ABC-2 type transport system ATP-binding protein